MMDAEWLRWLVGMGVTVVGIFYTWRQYALVQASRTTSIRVVAASPDGVQRNQVTLEIKERDEQELESSGAIVRAVWYRIADEVQGALPRFSGRWSPVMGDLQLRRGDVVWFRCVTANVSDRVLRDLRLSFYEFPDLRRVPAITRVVRRRGQRPVKSDRGANGASLYRLRTFSIERSGGSVSGETRLDHLNVFEQAFLDILFRPSPGLLGGWTFRRLENHLVEAILQEKPRPVVVTRSDQSRPAFLAAPD